MLYVILQSAISLAIITAVRLTNGVQAIPPENVLCGTG